MSDRPPTDAELMSRLDAAFDPSGLPVPDAAPVQDAIASQLLRVRLGVAAVVALTVLLLLGLVWGIAASATPRPEEPERLEPIEEPLTEPRTSPGDPQPASLGSLMHGRSIPSLTARPPTPARHLARAADREPSGLTASD
ncbi:MAG: hypothetical protein AAGB48_12015 [Planctomycetota bacterium]